jgi:hypothetical protein
MRCSWKATNLIKYLVGYVFPIVSDKRKDEKRKTQRTTMLLQLLPFSFSLPPIFITKDHPIPRPPNMMCMLHFSGIFRLILSPGSGSSLSSNVLCPEWRFPAVVSCYRIGWFMFSQRAPKKAVRLIFFWQPKVALPCRACFSDVGMLGRVQDLETVCLR